MILLLKWATGKLKLLLHLKLLHMSVSKMIM